MCLPASRSSWHILAYSHITPISISAVTLPFLLLISLPLSYKDPCYYIELKRIIQDNFLKILNLIASIKSPFPGKVTYSQILEIRCGPLWGPSFSLLHHCLNKLHVTKQVILIKVLSPWVLLKDRQVPLAVPPGIPEILSVGW